MTPSPCRPYTDRTPLNLTTNHLLPPRITKPVKWTLLVSVVVWLLTFTSDTTTEAGANIEAIHNITGLIVVFAALYTVRDWRAYRRAVRTQSTHT